MHLNIISLFNMNQTLKKLFTSSLLLITCYGFLSASSFSIDTLTIQQNQKKIPAGYKKDAELLATYIASDYTDEASKAFAISYWITTNIDFDYDGFIQRRPEIFPSATVLNSKKALCGEYAQLFKEMCGYAKLKALVIDGYSKDFDFLPNDTLFRSERVWSAVKINNQWKLIDFVNASGSFIPKGESSQMSDSIFYKTPYYAKCKYEKKFNPNWIFVSPAKMIYTHYPILNDLQLLEYPVPFDIFRQGESAIRKQLSINSDTIANSEEITQFENKSTVDKYLYIGDKGLKSNKFNNQLKGLSYLNALDTLIAQQYDTQKGIIPGNKAQIKKIKRYSTVADSVFKISLLNNDLEYRQMQKRSETWKANLKLYNKMHIDSLKNRTRINIADLKLIDNMYQKGFAITQFLNQKKDQFISKSLDGVKRPKTNDPTMNRETKQIMQQQDSLRKLGLGVLFNLENINRAYSQEKVNSIAATEKEALNIVTSNIDAIQQLAKNNKTTLSMVHIPTTNVEKFWLKKEIHKADSINKTNIDPMLDTLAANQLKFYDEIKAYTGFLKDRLNFLKLAKKGSVEDQKEDSLFNVATSNYADNLLSYHYELKTYTITKELLKDNLELENKKMMQLIEKLQNESDMENLRHKSYLEYRKQIKDAENLRTKLAMKRLIKLNTILDKSYLAAKNK